MQRSLANKYLVTDSLQAAKVSSKAKGDGRPLNFGVVIPGKIYRSSWPMVEDFQYLESLRLKTVLWVGEARVLGLRMLILHSSLVQKGFSPEFKGFLKQNDIRHRVIDMQGTKKVEITPANMHSIMEIVLDESNHPILIHCNHGKVRSSPTLFTFQDLTMV